jgi:predicted PurR-regulated permease PerM
MPADRPALGLAQRVAVIAGVVSLFVIGLAVLWLASTGLMAIAVGILLAVLFDAGARGLGMLVPLGRKACLASVLVFVALLFGAGLWWGGSILSQQAVDFMKAMKGLLDRGAAFVQGGGLGPLFRNVNIASFLPSGSMIYGGASEVVTVSFETISLAAAVLFLGAFFAWEPRVYKGVVLSLTPRERRLRADALLDQAGAAMRQWLVGQGINMLAIFLLSLCALLLVGMPYAVLLALAAGIFSFIPTIGPFLAGVVIVLAGLSVSFTMALYGLLVYVLVQFAETHLLTPLVQEETVRFPPASTLALQLIAGFLFGLIGVAFIVPLAAAGRVFVQELYINDRLGGSWPGGVAPTSWAHRWIVAVRDKLTGD